MADEGRTSLGGRYRTRNVRVGPVPAAVTPQEDVHQRSTHLRGRRVLVTGGSGTIGARLVDHLIESDPAVVRVFGRDETKQFYQRHRHRGSGRPLPDRRHPRSRPPRCAPAKGIDVVFHCAALKHVESGEYNPFEATLTNVTGTQNVIDACLASGVDTMILTSSDKAANPTSVMGASKLLAEKLVSAATNYRGSHPTTFASVRFGNVLGSRGSAIELFARQIAAGGPVTVTDPEMTRFIMSVDRAVELAIKAAEIARGGEVFVFKMPVARLADLISATIDVVAPTHGLEPAAIRREPIEPRAGEKAYEELMTEDESTRAVDIGDMFAVLPSIEIAPEVRSAYADLPSAPVGAYRSDGVEPLDLDGVRRLVAESFESERRAEIPA